MRSPLQRRCLAPHARERLWKAEQGPGLLPPQLPLFTEVPFQALPISFSLLPADQVALKQRAERAERNAASWHTLAMFLAGLLLVLVLR